MRLAITCILFGILGHLSAQCDSIYHVPDELAYLDSSQNATWEFFEDEIAPILSKAHKNGERIVDKLAIELIIDSQGEIISAKPLILNASDATTQNVIDVFLQMNKWVPARHNNADVCSRHVFLIKCILWDK